MSADRPDGPPLGDRLGRALRRLRDGTAHRSHTFAFRVDRPLETATVAELDRGTGVDYAVVAAGQVDDLSRPHERLYATTTPAGTDVVLLRIGGE